MEISDNILFVNSIIDDAIRKILATFTLNHLKKMSGLDSESMVAWWNTKLWTRVCTQK